MAFMNQEKKKELAPKIKDVFKKYGVKGSIRVRNHSTLEVIIRKGKLKFDLNGRDYLQIRGTNNYFTGKEGEFIKELNFAMNNGNHDNSDIMTDYFDVGWYTRIEIGEWNKPYVHIA